MTLLKVKKFNELVMGVGGVSALILFLAGSLGACKWLVHKANVFFNALADETNLQFVDKVDDALLYTIASALIVHQVATWLRRRRNLKTC